MNLIEAMRTEYCRSKKLLYWYALPIRGSVVVLALIGSLGVPTALSATLAVAALVSELVVFFYAKWLFSARISGDLQLND